jgi:hypothetical protein
LQTLWSFVTFVFIFHTFGTGKKNFKMKLEKISSGALEGADTVLLFICVSFKIDKSFSISNNFSHKASIESCRNLS